MLLSSHSLEPNLGKCSSQHCICNWHLMSVYYVLNRSLNKRRNVHGINENQHRAWCHSSYQIWNAIVFIFNSKFIFILLVSTLKALEYSFSLLSTNPLVLSIGWLTSILGCLVKSKIADGINFGAFDQWVTYFRRPNLATLKAYMISKITTNRVMTH